MKKLLFFVVLLSVKIVSMDQLQTSCEFSVTKADDALLQLMYDHGVEFWLPNCGFRAQYQKKLKDGRSLFVQVFVDHEKRFREKRTMRGELGFEKPKFLDEDELSPMGEVLYRKIMKVMDFIDQQRG